MLRLDAITVGDLEAMFELHSDPDVWRHLPAGRHSTKSQTASFITGMEAEWAEAGLGYWAARPLQDSPGGLGAGQFVGIGGCVRRAAGMWNLYYRLAPAAWGHGFATEIVKAARSAATTVDPQLPVVAYLLEHNAGSTKTAERAGLTLAWRGPDPGNPNSAAVRLIYSDRPLDESLVVDLTATA